MQWLNEPAQWSEQRGSLVVTADAATDFWRITGYGYVRDNGHLYAEQLAGDFELSMRVRGSYSAQYDQAGAMVRLDERRWLKTGVEYFDGRPRFSTVITLEHSSWVMADLPADMSELACCSLAAAMPSRSATASTTASWSSQRWRICRPATRCWPAPCARHLRAAASG